VGDRIRAPAHQHDEINAAITVYAARPRKETKLDRHLRLEIRYVPRKSGPSGERRLGRLRRKRGCGGQPFETEASDLLPALPFLIDLQNERQFAASRSSFDRLRLECAHRCTAFRTDIPHALARETSAS
jgi:hypothetical protein